MQEYAPFLPLLGVVLALVALVMAFRDGRRRRLIDNLPTSKTSGIFIGLVELKGTAECEAPLESYLAEQPCVHYAWTVEEHWSRTVTEMDNTLFSALTLNVQPLHLDAHFAAGTEFGQRIVNSMFTAGLMVGMSVNDTTVGTTVGNLGFTDMRFPKPVFHGDTLRARTKVVAMRESRSRPDVGIVDFEHTCWNQRDEMVAICRRQAMMRKKPQPGG